MRDLNWTLGAWRNVKEIDPYLAASNFPSALTQAANQTLRADWFISNIPNSSINAYFEFLGINSADPNIDRANDVNPFVDMATGAPATVRGGQAVSGTETYNRILTWHASSALGSGAVGSGHLFKSYNFDSDTGTADIFARPYRPTTNAPTAAGDYDFTFADSDNIFTLPNGLMGYCTTEGAASGQVMNVTNTGAGFPGPQFCVHCHDTATNLLPVSDQVNATIGVPASTMPTGLQALLKGMYDADATNGHLHTAGATYQAAYAKLNLPATETAGLNTECTNRVTNNYLVVLTVAMAAAEQGITASKLVGALQGTSLASPLGSLLVADENNVPTGVVRRDLWENFYPAVRKVLYPALPSVQTDVTVRTAASRLATPVRQLHGCMATLPTAGTSGL